MLTHENIVANSTQGTPFDMRGLNWEMDSQLGVLPFFHIYVSDALSLFAPEYLTDTLEGSFCCCQCFPCDGLYVLRSAQVGH